MEYKQTTESESKAWDELAMHPMQTWAWGDFRKQRQEISRLGVYESDKLIRGYLIMWTKTALGSIGYIPMGPVPSEEEIKRIREEGVRRGAIFIRMEPKSTTGTIDLPKGRQLFKPKTYWWDLKKSEDDLLSAMHQKGRYNIKVAQKHEVKIIEDNSEKAMETHIDLLMETAKRQGVKFHSRQYHKQLWKAVKNRLFFAKYENEVLASAMVFGHKSWGYYAYGGNSLMHREVMASTLLVWAIARILKKDGYNVFDLWGTEEGKGFSQFKEKFGADLVCLVGTYDLPVLPIMYSVIRLGEEVRWNVRQIWR